MTNTHPNSYAMDSKAKAKMEQHDAQIAANNRIAALEAQNKRLVEALEKIRDFDAKQRAGYVDEWEEAWAFSQCQTIANDLLTEVTK